MLIKEGGIYMTENEEDYILGINEFLSRLRDGYFSQTEETRKIESEIIKFAQETGEEINSENVDTKKIWYILDVLSTLHQLIEYEQHDIVKWVHELIENTYEALLFMN